MFSDLRTRTLKILQDITEHLPIPSVEGTDAEVLIYHLSEGIARFYGLVGGGQGMADVVSVIGAGQDYSAPDTWAADLDNGVLYSSGDVAIGKGKAESFSTATVISGGGTVGLSKRILTADAADRHDGTAGSGPRIVTTSGTGNLQISGAIDTDVEWWELHKNFTSNANHRWLENVPDAGSGQIVNIRNCLIHGGGVATQSFRSCIALDPDTVAGTEINVINTAIYDINHAASGSPQAVAGAGGSATARLLNCVIYDVVGSGGGGVNRTNWIVQNTISMGTSTDFANTAASESYNMSSDATAGGTGSLTSKTASNQFVSVTAGSEDFHLKTGADAIDAGTDLGTTPTGIEIDIDQNDRTSASTWDMGIHEFELAGGGGVTIEPTAINAIGTVVAPTTVLGSLIVSGILSTAIGTSIDPSVALGSVSLSPVAVSGVGNTTGGTAQLGSITLSPTAVNGVGVVAGGTVQLGSIAIDGILSSAIGASLAPSVVQSSITVANLVSSGVGDTTNDAPVLGSISYSPSVVFAVGTTVDPTIPGSVIVVPSASTTIGQVVDPSVQLGSVAVDGITVTAPGVSVAPNVQLGSISFEPSVSSGVGASVDPALVLGSVSVAPTASGAIGTSVDPASVLGSLTIAPPVSSSIASTVDPATIFGSITVDGITAGSVAAAVDPSTVLGSIAVTPSVTEAVGVVVDPSVVDGSDIVVTPNASVTVGATVNPTTVLGSVSITVTAADVLSSTTITVSLSGISSVIPSPVLVVADASSQAITGDNRSHIVRADNRREVVVGRA